MLDWFKSLFYRAETADDYDLGYALGQLAHKQGEALEACPFNKYRPVVRDGWLDGWKGYNG